MSQHIDRMPSGEDFRAASVVRAWEPPEEVVIPRALAMADGLQPEDYGVLIRLLLRDPGRPSSVLALAEEFQAAGWRMGEKRLREVMKRLRAAGHVKHERSYNTATQRPEWQFHVYRNPANNRAYVDRGTKEASQVAPIGPFPPDDPSADVSDPAETGVCAGQADRAEIGVSAPIRRKSADRKPSVSAGQSVRAVFGGSDALPPHPPEEVDTSSPYPLTNPSGTTAKEEGDGSAIPEEQITAASDFLQDLPAPWRAGRATAKRLAPKLAEAIIEQGWSLDDALLKQLTENPGGIHHYPKVLAARIADLPRRSAPRPHMQGPKLVPREEPGTPNVGNGAQPNDEYQRLRQELAERRRRGLL